MKTTNGALVVFILSLPLTSIGLAQSTAVSWFALNMGYGAAQADNTSVLSLMGQGYSGNSRAVDTEIIGGFLANPMASGIVLDVPEPEELPAVFMLAQNYPNPFNPTTTVHFELPVAAQVTLKVYNVLGQEVMTAVDEERPAGRYDVNINAAALSSGAYFYRLQAEARPTGSGATAREGPFVRTKKFLLLR
jgi:hypothetical protein